MEGLFFLSGLFGIVWLAFWVAQEGRGLPKAKRRWSPFDWADHETPPAPESPLPRKQGTSWRDRSTSDRKR
jgi:hypothetical protein